MTIVEIDVRKPGHSTLTPILAKRIEDFADRHDEFVSAQVFAYAVMARLWQLDQTLQVLAVVDEAKGVLGHTVTQIEDQGKKPVALMVQAKADGDVGDAMTQAYTRVQEWARSKGATSLVVITQRDPEALERKYGFKLSRRILAKSLEPQGA